jgi:hypothetical protein
MHLLESAVSAAPKMQMSPSVPFLKVPDALDGKAPGDIGFDPLGFSSLANINFLREAEIKHGRKSQFLSSCFILSHEQPTRPS